MGRALEFASVSAADLTAIETDAVDPAARNYEIVSQIADVLDVPERKSPAILGSAADIVGQTRAASGMAALLKAVVQFQTTEDPLAAINGQVHGAPQTCAVMSLSHDLAYCAIVESAEQALDGKRPVAVACGEGIREVVESGAHQPVP